MLIDAHVATGIQKGRLSDFKICGVEYILWLADFDALGPLAPGRDFARTASFSAGWLWGSAGCPELLLAATETLGACCRSEVAKEGIADDAVDADGGGGLVVVAPISGAMEPLAADGATGLAHFLPRKNFVLQWALDARAFFSPPSSSFLRLWLPLSSSTVLTVAP